MNQSLMRYSAITAKVRAMYGRRLTQEDFTRLRACKSIAEAIGYLGTCPGWQRAVEHLGTAGVGRSKLENALRAHLMEEYVRLYRFAGLEDKGFLLFPLYKFELEAILASMRQLMSPIRHGEYFRPVDDFFLQRSKLDYGMLEHAESWRSIVQAAEGTMYHPLLQAAVVSMETGLPDYTVTSVALQGVYYSAMHRFVVKRYQGEMSKAFLTGVGSEIDLLNLAHIMRLKRYFPESEQRAEHLLFPVFHKLKPEFFQRLLAAPDYDRAMALLEETVYARLFREHDFPYIDQYYETRMLEFNQSQLVSGGPSPYIAAAYLAVKEAEMKRMFSLIESIYYGLQDTVKFA